ncbi:DUF3871 family protein [Leeuwenhoekiella aequorea]|uniref:DUF3871 family protein n=1 Tax=Leeuwenhoekiella aequorea TaxID=283736 RepID=UPI00352CB66E
MMELIKNPNPRGMIQEESTIQSSDTSNFIEANTQKVTLQHLKNDCIIPVFSKDNETTLSHYQFIQRANEVITSLFPEYTPKAPDIRVSHVVKGRVPSAIGKPAKELLEHEKTIYYERCAFLINLPNCKQIINGNELSLSIGGVRAYNQENLYSKKSLEKFKVFIGFQNRVCTNLCISTDGFSNELRISSIGELEDKMAQLFSNYNRDAHLKTMEQMNRYKLSEKQFAHLIGKLRMYPHLNKQEQMNVFPISLNDGQINTVVRDYYQCENFSREPNGEIGLWQLYNLFTEANKSSYIDSNLERNVNAYELVHNLSNSIEIGEANWFLHN